MRGAVAAGHHLTAPGARILAEGGGAVDACTGAAFTSRVAASPLAGRCAGWLPLVHRAREEAARLVDGRRSERAEPEAIERPRRRHEDAQVHWEEGADGPELNRLEALGCDLARRWRRNLLCGRVVAVQAPPTGAPGAPV
jgi:gamma-glutamyltranspeptidase